MQTIAFSAMFYSLLVLAISMVFAPLVQKYLPFLFMHNPGMLTCTIAAVAPACGTAVPGVSRLHLALAGDIANFPAIGADHTISTAITMVATKGFHEIKIVPEQSMFEDLAVGAKGAKYNNPKITVKIKGLDGPSQQALNALSDGYYVAILTLTDGTKLVVGSRTSPIEIDDNTFKSGQTGSSDYRGTDLVLSGFSATKAVIYTGTIPLAP